MGKLNSEQYRECHHFHLWPFLNLYELRDLRQQVFMQIYEHCENVVITLQVMKNLPLEIIILQWLERKENLKSTLREYIRLLLEEDPWIVKNLPK